MNDPGLFASDRAGKDAVLLLDEIDKADPDVPNDLLEPFGNKTFTVRETGEKVRATRDVLVILTTNRERELPQAFLRRCVVLALEPPTVNWFIEVAHRKLGNATGDLYKLVADRIMELREAADAGGHRLPGTGEFLDAIQAWRQLQLEGNFKAFKEITLAAAWKQPKAPS